jgi:2-oxoglutarate ferredoxin oxidoreductase subunit delta
LTVSVGVSFFHTHEKTPTLYRAVMSKKKGQAKVTIYPDWCKGCGICAAFCPSKVLELRPDGKAHVVREEDCVNCGFCELHCPDFAISVIPREISRRKTDAFEATQGGPLDPSAGTDPGPEENVGTPNREDEHGHKKA